MKQMCLWLTVMLFLTGLAVGFTVSVAADTVYSGEWDGLEWELNATTGHLTISGDGPMTGMYYDHSGDEAWLVYKKQIKTVTIEEGVTSIGDGAFGLCSQMKSINLPDSIVSIGDFAFSSCISLTEIVIPKNVSSIGMEVFATCTHLTSMVVAEENETYHSDGNCIIDTERKMLIAGCKNSVIPDDGSVSIIGVRAFCECYGLKTMVIPNGVKIIGQSAFSHCYDLATVYISDSVEEIEIRAFYASDNLKQIFYCGTAEQWSNVSQMMDYLDNEMNYTLSHHAWNSGEVAHAPTHLELGEKILTCTLCDAKETVSVDKLKSHTYGEWRKVGEERHERSCACGVIQSEKHRFDDSTDTDCNKCGYIRVIEAESVMGTEETNETVFETNSEPETEKSGWLEIPSCQSSVSASMGMICLLVLSAGAMFRKKED